MFAILVFICIENYLHKIQLVTIDDEYLGRERDIKNHIMNLFKINNIKFDKNKIVFNKIGKKSKAHKIAYNTFSGELAPNRIIIESEIKKYL